MRKVTITRKEGPLGGHVDVKIVSNTVVLGELKADEETKTFELGNSEQAIQAVLYDEVDNPYRSNVYFAIYGSKDIKLFLTISGTRMMLSAK